MRREWGPEDLIECWTLADGNRRLVGRPGRHGSGSPRCSSSSRSRLASRATAARYPRRRSDTWRIEVAPEEFASYDLAGRSAKYHRAQVREAFGFREATRSDEEALVAWLAEEVCPVELNEKRVREALPARCRAERIEPPGRIARIMGAAGLSTAAVAFQQATSSAPSGTTAWGSVAAIALAWVSLPALAGAFLPPGE